MSVHSEVFRCGRRGGAVEAANAELRVSCFQSSYRAEYQGLYNFLKSL